MITKTYLHLVRRPIKQNYTIETADYPSDRRIKLDGLFVQNGQRHFLTLRRIQPSDSDCPTENPSESIALKLLNEFEYSIKYIKCLIHCDFL